MTHRTRRRIAKAIAPREDPSAKTKVREGVVVSVDATTPVTATVYLNGDSATPIAGYPIAPGLTLSANQVVEVTFTGRAPLITDRIT